MSSLIFVSQGFPFFQAIQRSQFLEYQRNLWIRTHLQEIFQQEPYPSEAQRFKPFAF
jgi:hypothetical protein